MPLTFVKVGETACIRAITGKDETRRFLGDLGISQGQSNTVVADLAGNMILSVKNARIALDKTLANRIQVICK